MNCAHIYDEQAGDPEAGLAPGTRWEDIPDDWICPECGSEKRDYELIDWQDGISIPARQLLTRGQRGAIGLPCTRLVP